MRCGANPSPQRASSTSWSTSDDSKTSPPPATNAVKTFFIAQDEVEAQRETLITDVEGKLKQQQELTPLFTIRWSLT